jgi:hypothetical protein
MVLAQPLLIGVEMMRMPFGHDVEHRPVGRERHVLLEPRDSNRGLPPDGAAVRRQFAADDSQEGRLARTIAADDGHALAGVDLKRHLIQERYVAEREGDTVQRSEEHRSKRTTASR